MKYVFSVSIEQLFLHESRYQTFWKYNVSTFFDKKWWYTRKRRRMTVKRTLSLRTLRSFRTLNKFCAAKISCFLVIVYGRVSDRDKFSWGNYGLRRSRFSYCSHLKITAKESFSKLLMPQCNGRISL